jgi:hypothetical protein
MKKFFALVACLLLLVGAGSVFAAATETPYKTGVVLKAEGAITLDGFSDEWENAMKFKADPMYTGDSTDALPKSMLWMMWDEKNLYFFVRVMDTKISAVKPAEFWAVDCVEFFVDGKNTKGAGYDPSSAQFWFCPAGGGKDATGLYIGQWKRPGDAIKETLYGAVPGVEGGLNVDEKGYTMEIKVPATSLGLKAFAAAQKIGFNYTISDLESGATFWATSKNVNTHEHPNLWGTLTLVK